MADKAALEFIQRVESDEALAERVRAAGSVDGDQAFAELARIAEGEGYAVSPESLQAALVESARHLDDKELEGVAGGAISGFGNFSLKTSAFSSFYSNLRGLVGPSY